MSGGGLDGAGEAGSGPAGDRLTARPGPLGRPARLRAGDRVAVVSPSGPVEPDRLEAGCARLRDLGFDAVIGKHALDRTGLGPDPGPEGSWRARRGWSRRGLAGSDADRAADLQDAWCDPEVRAVMCARGGYGATRILDVLDWAALAEAAAEQGPTLLHGSSDITALHSAFGSRLGVTTSFGPMAGGLLADRAVPAETREHLRAALTGPGEPVTGGRTLRGGRAAGILTGGTLSLLVALLGTPYAAEPADGRIALLEDVAEPPYRVDRMLTQLLQSGWLDGVAGIALGTWVGCGPPGELDEVFAGRLGGLDVPVLAGLPVGHGPRQLTVELGAPVRLDADARTLTPRWAAGGAS